MLGRNQAILVRKENPLTVSNDTSHKCPNGLGLRTSPLVGLPNGHLWLMSTPSKTDAFKVWRSRIAGRRFTLDKAVLAVAVATAPEPGQRSRAGQQRSAARKATRATQTKSMMNMGAPKGHVALPRFPSERERVMFAAHESRKNAGWIRG